MKYLTKINEDMTNKDVVIKGFISYKSDIISKIVLNTNRTPYYTHPTDLNFIITYVNDTNRYLRIRFNIGLTHRIEAFIDGTSFFINAKDIKSVLLEVERLYRLIRSHDRKMEIKDKMFEVITRELLEDYFADILDNKEYNIKKEDSIVDSIFWRITLKHTFINYNNGSGTAVLIDDNHTDTMDTLISTSERLKMVFDVSTLYKIQSDYFFIYILANDDEGKPIGFGYI